MSEYRRKQRRAACESEVVTLIMFGHFLVDLLPLPLDFFPILKHTYSQIFSMKQSELYCSCSFILNGCSSTVTSLINLSGAEE